MAPSLYIPLPLHFSAWIIISSLLVSVPYQSLKFCGRTEILYFSMSGMQLGLSKYQSNKRFFKNDFL